LPTTSARYRCCVRRRNNLRTFCPISPLKSGRPFNLRLTSKSFTLLFRFASTVWFRVENDLQKNLALQKIENVKLQNQISAIK
jgi:hypothetical protein